MSIDDTFAETWRDAEEYFEDHGFEGTRYEIEAEGEGTSLEEAADSAAESTSGTMKFEKEDIKLEFNYNPMAESGTLNIKEYSSEAEEEDIEQYVEDLEDMLGADIDYSLG